MNIKIMCCIVALLLAIGLLGGCLGVKVQNNVAFDVETFQKMESKWQSATVDNYTFQYVETGAKEKYDLKVKVVNGARETISKNTENSAMRYDDDLSIKTLINDIKKNYEENNGKRFDGSKEVYIKKINVSYNEKSGYPEVITYEYNKPAEGMIDIRKIIQIKAEI